MNQILVTTAITVIAAAVSMGCGGRNNETPSFPTTDATPTLTAVAPTATPKAEFIPDDLQPGDRIQLRVYADAPDDGGDCVDSFLEHMVPSSAADVAASKVVNCVVDDRAAMRLEFGQPDKEGVYELRFAWVLLLLARDDLNQDCSRKLENGSLWPPTSDPAQAPLKGVCADYPAPRGRENGRADAFAALPGSAAGKAADGEPCWRLIRFLGGPLNQPTPVTIRCQLGR